MESSGSRPSMDCIIVSHQWLGVESLDKISAWRVLPALLLGCWKSRCVFLGLGFLQVLGPPWVLYDDG